MAVDIHKTRDDSGAVQINGIGGEVFRQYGCKFSINHFKAACMKAEVGTVDPCVFIKHNTTPYKE